MHESINEQLEERIMFARTFFAIAIGMLGFIGAASAQEIIYQPLLVTPLKSVAGFHPEDAAKYKQMQRIADYAHTAVAVTNNDRDILYAQFEQKLTDAAYLGAKLVPIAEALKAKLDGHSLDEDAIDAWASTLVQFATAVIYADFARIAVADSVPFGDCDKIPQRTFADVSTCIAETRDRNAKAEQVAPAHRQTLDALIAGGPDVNLIRHLIVME